MIDPQTMQSFWSALIALMIAGAAALQQWNAAKGRQRGEQAQKAAEDAANAAKEAKMAVQTVAEHGQVVTQKLDNISDTVNGATTELKDTIAQQAKQIADLKKPS